jgi:uncharacterized protein (TIGR04255 family)
MNKAGESLPIYEQIRFKNPALELTLVQLKYPPLPRFSEEGYLNDIKEALAQEYPLIGTEQPISIIISVQGVSQSINQAPHSTFHRFTSIDHRWSVLLTNEAISLETRTYTGITEFSKRFAEILTHVGRFLQPQYQLRFGLRYINEFRHPERTSYLAWQGLLSADFLGLAAQGVLDGVVEQTISEVRTRREDGTLLVRHGFLKGTTVMPAAGYSAKTGPFYLLDMDYYDESSTRFDAEKLIKYMLGYNDILYRVFRWAIGESELYHQLRGEP